MERTLHTDDNSYSKSETPMAEPRAVVLSNPEAPLKPGDVS